MYIPLQLSTIQEIRLKVRKKVHLATKLSSLTSLFTKNNKLTQKNKRNKKKSKKKIKKMKRMKVLILHLLLVQMKNSLRRKRDRSSKLQYPFHH